MPVEREGIIFEVEAQGVAKTTRQLDGLGDELGQLDNEAKQVSGSFGGLKTKSAALGGALGGGTGGGLTGQFAAVNVGIGALTANVQNALGAIKGLFEFAKGGAESLGIAEEFERLGQTADDLERLEKAVGGAVSGTQLQILSNTAKAFGATNEQIERFAQISVTASRKTGEAFDSVSKKIIEDFGKGSTGALEGLGVSAKKLDAQLDELKANAVEPLTKAQELAAIQQIIWAESMDDTFSPALTGVTQEFAKVDATIANFESTLQETAATLLVESGAFEIFEDLIGEISVLVLENKDLLIELAQDGMEAVREILPIIIDNWRTLSPLMELLGPILKLVTSSMKSLSGQFRIMIGTLKTFAGVVGTAFLKPLELMISAAAEAAGFIDDDLGDALQGAADTIGDFADSAVDLAAGGLTDIKEGALLAISPMTDLGTAAFESTQLISDFGKTAILSAEAVQELQEALEASVFDPRTLQEPAEQAGGRGSGRQGPSKATITSRKFQAALDELAFEEAQLAAAQIESAKSVVSSTSKALEDLPHPLLTWLDPLRPEIQGGIDEMEAQWVVVQERFAGIAFRGPDILDAPLFGWPPLLAQVKDGLTALADEYEDSTERVKEAHLSEELEKTTAVLGEMGTLLGAEGDSPIAAGMLNLGSGIAKLTKDLRKNLKAIEKSTGSAEDAFGSLASGSIAVIGGAAAQMIGDSEAFAFVQGLVMTARSIEQGALFIASYGADFSRLAASIAFGVAAGSYFTAAGKSGSKPASVGASSGASVQPFQGTANVEVAANTQGLSVGGQAAALAPIFIVNEVVVSAEEVVDGVNEVGRQNRNVQFGSNVLSSRPNQPRF